MTTKYGKAGKRLRKIKTIPQRQFVRFKQTLNTRLAQLDDDLHTLLQNHTFLYNAVINLADDELAPELWLAGAVSNHRLLNQSGKT